MAGQSERKGNGAAVAGLIIFTLYVILLALAAASEVFNLGWFDFPVFK